MRVLHLGTSDCLGGAARAMYRWHVSLRKLGVESEILCLNKSSGDENVSAVPLDWNDQATVESVALQRYFVESNRTAYTDTFFSHPLGYVSIVDHELVKSADLIHLHWTSLFFSWDDIRRIKALGKLIVLTPHDLWPATGGCHYPKGCDGYLKECMNCPQLVEDPYVLISNSRAFKQSVIADAIDLILSPSHWMDQTFAQLVRLRKVQREVVPYCVDVSQFHVEKERSKRELGFDSHRRLILFCAEHLTEGRKGLDQLIEVLRICENRSELRTVLEQYADFVLIGKGGDRLNLPTKFAVHGRGYVKTIEDLCRFYSAADLLIYLGLEDNLPNVILEAMACGTPVLAFETGGVSDMITEGVTGGLVRIGSVDDFAVKLGVMLGDARKLLWLGLNGRETVLKQFSDRVVGPRLRQFYEALSHSSKRNKKASFSDETAFQTAAQRAVRVAIAKGYRCLEEERNTLKASSEQDAKQTEALRSEIAALHSKVIELRDALERERRKSLWDLFKERLQDRIRRWKRVVGRLHGIPKSD